MIIKRVWLALVALLVTLAYVGAAHGEKLTFIPPPPQETIEFISEGPLTFEAGGGAIRVSCQITLSGSLSSTSFTMTEGTQFGSLSSSRVESCSGGSLSFLRMAESPNRLTYRGFLGTLPNITAIRHRIGEVKLQSTGLMTCLFTGDVEALMALEGSDAWLIEADTISTGRLALSSGALCPESGTLSGRFALANTQLALNDPIIEWRPNGINFGSVAIGDSEAITSRFENKAGAQIEITEVRTRGTGCAHYTFTNGAGRLAPRGTLDAGRTIDIIALFRPSRAGQFICLLEVGARQGGGAAEFRSLIVGGRGF